MDVLDALAAPLRLVHALSGVLLVAGLLGRWVTLSHAERATHDGDLRSVQALLGASAVFERLVIFSSILVLLLGLLAAWGLGYPLLGFLQGGSANWLLVSLVLFLSTIPLVPAVFLPRGRIFGAALADSVALGRPTPGLVAAFGDRVTRAAHWYELLVMLVVLALMIAKPF